MFDPLARRKEALLSFHSRSKIFFLKPRPRDPYFLVRAQIPHSNAVNLTRYSSAPVLKYLFAKEPHIQWPIFHPRNGLPESFLPGFWKQSRLIAKVGSPSSPLVLQA